jgi:hypothetical protein
MAHFGRQVAPPVLSSDHAACRKWHDLQSQIPYTAVATKLKHSQFQESIFNEQSK